MQQLFLRTTWRPSSRFAFLLMLLISTIASGTVWAQNILPASTPDGVMPNAATNVLNTGTGLCTAGKDLLHAMVWDGPSQGYRWVYYPASGAAPVTGTYSFLNLNVQDPDVVAFYDPKGPGVIGYPGWQFMIAVYQVPATGNGHSSIFMEAMLYNQDANGGDYVVRSTLISSDMLCDATNPNIDINPVTGEAVIVFEQGGSIWARTYTPQLGTLYQGTLSDLRRIAANVDIVDVDCLGNASSHTYVTHSQPDVAIGLDDMVSITYRTRTSDRFSATSQINLAQAPYSLIKTPAVTASATLPTLVAFGPVPDPQLLEYPRIAAPINASSNTDCIITVRHNDGNEDKIYALARYSSAPGTIATYLVNRHPQLLSLPNVRPVVSYVSGNAIVVWQFDNDETIISRVLQVDGSPIGDFLTVNETPNGGHFVPSVEGRGGLNKNGSVMWYKGAASEIHYKEFDINSGSVFRSAAGSTVAPNMPHDKTVLSVHPNPATADASIQIRLNKQAQVKTLEILDSRTGQVIKKLPTTSLVQDQSTELALPQLSEGLYLLRLITSDGPYLIRFSYQP